MKKNNRRRTKKRKFVHHAIEMATKNQWDAMVPLPKEQKTLSVRAQVTSILKTLQEMGYTCASLTHTIYGPPKKEDDHADRIIPTDLWHGCTILKVYRRLHVVVENVSTLGYLTQWPDLGYDVVSIAPRNEAAFRATCAGPNAAKIITLDYAGGGEIFQIRSSDIKAAISRNVAFEFTYSPAVLHRNARKALVRVSLDLQSACTGLSPIIIISSGERQIDGTDVGDLALRSVLDVRNLASTVLRWNDTTATNALSMNADRALQQSKEVRLGKNHVVQIDIVATPQIHENPVVTDDPLGEVVQPPSEAPKPENKEEPDDDEDGFIAL